MIEKKSKKWSRKERKAYVKRFAYAVEVEAYLGKDSGALLEAWANLCEKTRGRVSYEELEEILGNFPKAPWIDANDKKEQMKAFFTEIDAIYIADETHIYFL